MAGGGYNHHRLPLIRRVLDLVYRFETISVQRVGTSDARSQQHPGRAWIALRCSTWAAAWATTSRVRAVVAGGRFTGVDHVAENVLLCQAYGKLRRLDNVAFRESDIRDPARLLGTSPSPRCCMPTTLSFRSATRIDARENGVWWSFRMSMLQTTCRARTARPRRSGIDGGTPADVIAAVERWLRNRAVLACQAGWPRAEDGLRRILQGAKRGMARASIAALLLVAYMPFYLLVQWIDFARTPASGAGLLIVARPQASPQSR